MKYTEVISVCRKEILMTVVFDLDDLCSCDNQLQSHEGKATLRGILGFLGEILPTLDLPIEVSIGRAWKEELGPKGRDRTVATGVRNSPISQMFL